MEFILWIIFGFFVGIVLMSTLQINKIKNYEKQIGELMKDNMGLMLELHELKYGKNKHITMQEGK